MNWILFLFAFLFSSEMSLLEPPYSAVEQAFNQSDASKLIGLAKERVVLSISLKETVCAQPQAIQILKDFFSKHQGLSFKYLAKSKDNESATAIGQLSNKVEQFNVTLRWSKANAELKLESIRIEKSN